MATTNIKLDIENITGVGSGNADAQYIISAQKFAVASVPKNLLKWAATFTVPGNHGGNTSDGVKITMPIGTDSILDVSRNGFSVTEVPYSMKGFIANTASLHLATDTYPKYYLDDANPGEGVRIIVKPIPTDDETAVALYVDSSKVDDDCDLRNVVIFHASAQEFEKLASGKVADWSDLTVPIAPASPDFGSNFSITAVSPSIPSLTSVTFSSIDSDVDASAPVFTTASVAAGSVYTGSAPTYSSPVKQSQVAFADYWTLADFGDADPDTFTISAALPVPPASPSISSPGVASQDKANISGEVPTYTAPVMSAPDFTDANTWINTEEDPEMVAARIQTINAQISEFGARIQDSLNSFNKENAKYQANIQAEITKAQIDSQEKQKEGDLTFQATVQDYSQELALFGAKVQEYQAEVGKEVQAYTQNLSRYQLELNTVYTAWAKTESDNISLYQSDIQNELNSFNKRNVAFQAQVQESMQEIQVTNQVNIAKAQSDLQLSISNEDRSQQRQLQNSVQDMQAIVSDNESKMSKFQGEVSTYQADIGKEVQEYTQVLDKISKEYQSELALYGADMQKYQAEVGEKTQKITSATQNAAYYSNESKKYYEWAIAEVNMYIQNNSKMINKTMAAQAAAQQRR
jgi:hypothetical protein